MSEVVQLHLHYEVRNRINQTCGHRHSSKAAAEQCARGIVQNDIRAGKMGHEYTLWEVKTSSKRVSKVF